MGGGGGQHSLQEAHLHRAGWGGGGPGRAPGGRLTGQAFTAQPRSDGHTEAPSLELTLRHAHTQGGSALKGGQRVTWYKSKKTQQIHCKNTAKQPWALPTAGCLPGRMRQDTRDGPRGTPHTGTHSHVSRVGGPPRQSLIFKKRLTMYYS